MNDDLIKREQLSALADGETSQVHVQAALAYAESDEGQQTWRMYHLIGDVLRSPELAHHSQHDMLSSLRGRLQEEQRRKPANLAAGVLDQIAPVWETKAVGNGAPVQLSGHEAANASVFRWKMAAGVASMAAVAAIGWSIMLGMPGGQQGFPAPGAQLAAGAAVHQPAQGLLATAEPEIALGAHAQASSVVAVAGPNGQSVMLRDSRLDELLAAQTQQSSAATLQMPASFLRNANFATTGQPASR